MNSCPTKSISSPISYQLQFNFKFRKCPKSLVFVRSRTLNAGDHQRRRHRLIVCVAENGAKEGSGSESGRRRFSSSWDDDNSTAFSDWSGDVDQSGGSGQKQGGIGGILGLGIAGIFMVAGITFVATSIGKRSSSRPKLEMEQLTKQQETLLTSREDVHQEEPMENDGKSNFKDQPMSASSRFSQFESSDSIYSTSMSVDPQYGIAVSKTEENVGAIRIISSDTDANLLGTNHQQGTLTASQTDVLQVSFESSSSIDLPTSVGSQASVLETRNVARSSKYDDTLIGISSSQVEPAGVVSYVAQSSTHKQGSDNKVDIIGDGSVLESQSSMNEFPSNGIPAPLLLSSALQVGFEKVLVPQVTDQNHAQALAALQVLKVIESDADPGELCKRRDYARWLVSASSALSRNSISKVYPAMYIENVTELAFDDVTAKDPDFTSIQGLAEAGLISSKLSRLDMLSSPEEDIGSLHFQPDSPLSRQDLVTWKMALEKRHLPEADRKLMRQLSGFIDIDKINPDAWPALVADLSEGEQGIVAQAFGYTRLFQPDKPVTKGQAAIALATGDTTDIVSEELTRIEAESMAEKAVSAHNALVAEVENDINVSFEKELIMEREKIHTVQKMADEAKKEVEKLRREREEQNISLIKERTGIESEIEALNRLRLELEEQLQSVASNKVEVSYEKERVEKLRKETEVEKLAVSRLQYELEIELKALSMARAWAEDEAKRVQEHAKILEEARDRWERQGIKVVVDEDLRKEAALETTWLNARKPLSVEETVDRAENLTDNLKLLACKVEGKSKEIINEIIEKIQLQISVLKECLSIAEQQTNEFRSVAVGKVGGTVQGLQLQAVDFGSTVRERAKRFAEDCREGIEKLTQRFKP